MPSDRQISPDECGLSENDYSASLQSVSDQRGRVLHVARWSRVPELGTTSLVLPKYECDNTAANRAEGLLDAHSLVCENIRWRKTKRLLVPNRTT